MPRRDVMPQPTNVRWRWVFHDACERKQPMTVEQAYAAVKHQPDRRLSMYRCPFEVSHWHVGRTPDLKTLRKLASAIRARAQEAR